MEDPKGSLFIVSAPSGAGKSTMCRILLEKVPGISFAVSHTTRPPRPGERDGVDYHFVSVEEFLAMRDQGGFLEWAEVHGNYYGTSRTMLEGLLARGLDVIHDIDVQGARQIRGLVPGAVYVFVLPPSMAALRERLAGRGSDSEEVIQRRLGNAVGEIRDFSSYDYVILNDALDDAVRDFESLIRARRLRRAAVNSAWVEKTFFSQEET